MTIKPTIALILLLYCIAIVVLTHIKTRSTAFAQKVNNGFAMSTMWNLLLLTLVIAVIMPRLYIRWATNFFQFITCDGTCLFIYLISQLVRKGKLSGVPPFLMTLSVYSPYWIFMMIIPASLYIKDASLRKYVLRSIRKLGFVQQLQAIVNRKSTSVGPSQWSTNKERNDREEER